MFDLLALWKACCSGDELRVLMISATLSTVQLLDWAGSTVPAL